MPRRKSSNISSHPEAQGFLANIIDHPDEDNPRLIYADWLEEHGETDRAEFIRLHVEDHSKYHWGRDRNPNHRRISDLYLEHRDKWWKEMPRLPGIRWWCFWRGFPGIYVDNWAALRRNAPRIWSVAPVEHVTLSTLSVADARALGKSRLLKRIRVLGFNWIGSNGMGAFRELLRSSKLVHIRNLELKSCGLGNEGAKVIAECPHLTNLIDAYLDCNEIHDAGALAIARSPHLTGLVYLAIGRNPFTKRADKVLRKRFPKGTF
jgi:uncharacterized protein (TIGR02996 family)